jgi:chromosome partitioning protein
VAQIIAIANQKGGVGKTTTAVNLAASLAVAEQRTLLIDGDPQGNATSGVGLEGERLTHTVYDALIGKLPLDDVILRAIQFAHLDVAPTTPDLAGAEIELIDEENRELAMRDAIAPIRDRYDYILIDCPPSLGLLTINMLAAADSVLIPVQCEYYALEGLSQLLNTVHRIQQSVNPKLAIDGVLLTMYDARLNLSRQVVTDAREYFGPKVFETIVPRNVRLAEAPSFGKPIVLYDIASVGAQAYLGVAREIIRRSASPVTPSAEPMANASEQPNLHTEERAPEQVQQESQELQLEHAAAQAPEQAMEHAEEHGEEHAEEQSEQQVAELEPEQEQAAKQATEQNVAAQSSTETATETPVEHKLAIAPLANEPAHPAPSEPNEDSRAPANEQRPEAR